MDTHKEACTQIDTYANHRDLPFRSHEDYRHDGEASLADPRLARRCGVNGVSPFAHLPTISIPQSSPFDVMHLVYLNFVRDLCKLLTGTFFQDNHPNENAAKMESGEWEVMGAEMAKIESPGSWGRYRDVYRRLQSGGLIEF